jgi:hypothetical protein
VSISPLRRPPPDHRRNVGKGPSAYIRGVEAEWNNIYPDRKLEIEQKIQL